MSPTRFPSRFESVFSNSHYQTSTLTPIEFPTFNCPIRSFEDVMAHMKHIAAEKGQDSVHRLIGGNASRDPVPSEVEVMMGRTLKVNLSRRYFVNTIFVVDTKLFCIWF